MNAEVMEKMRIFLFDDMEIKIFGDRKGLGLLEKIFDMMKNFQYLPANKEEFQIVENSVNLVPLNGEEFRIDGNILNLLLLNREEFQTDEEIFSILSR